MDPLTMALIMGGIGLGKSMLVDAPAQRRMEEIESIKTKYSPWTGQHGDMAKVKVADPFGTAAQFGMTGAMLGQSLENQALDRAIKERLASGGVVQSTAPASVWEAQDDRSQDIQNMLRMQRGGYANA